MTCEKCPSTVKVTGFEIRIPSKNGQPARSYWKRLCEGCVRSTITTTKPAVAPEILAYFEAFIWSQPERKGGPIMRPA